MSYWSGVTRNLIMQNSALVRQHGGDLGITTWSYVVGIDGVKTIDPTVGFYLHPPPNSGFRWSTDGGRCPPNHIVIGTDGSEDAMPPRQLVDWNDDTIQIKAEQYRRQYWEELKHLVRPNTFEDLYQLFDSATLWHNGAYNLWKLVNALVTLAHDQFPFIMQEWKDYIEKVVYNVFRPVAGSRLVRQNSNNNNMQVLRNQHVLTDWDRTVDPLILLQHTTFPVGDLPFMNVQQHGLLRELLICEHIRLTGTRSPIPHYFNLPRPVVNTTFTPAAPGFVENESQRASVNDTIQTKPSNTLIQAASVDVPPQGFKSRTPLVVVGVNDPDGRPNAHRPDVPNLCKEPFTSVTGRQSPVTSSPSPVFLPSIPEESTASKAGENASLAEAEIVVLSSNDKPTSPDTQQFISMGPPEVAPPPVETKPTEAMSLAPDLVTRVTIPMAEPGTTESEAPIPNIVTEEATPPPDSPMRDRKDSNGSTDKLFFPDAPSDKLHVERQHSIVSAPDQDTETMLSIAEKKACAVSETPPAMQAHCDEHQKHAFQSASGAFTANNSTSRGSPRLSPVPGCYQGPQQSGLTEWNTQSTAQHGRQIGPSPPHSSQMMAPCGPPNGMNRNLGPSNLSPLNMQPNSNGPFIPSPSSMLAGPNGFNPHYGLPPPPDAAMPMGLPMGLPRGHSMGPPMGLPVGPHLQHQMPLHMEQQFSPHGPHLNTSFPFVDRQSQGPPGYLPNGYIHQPRHYGSYGEQGDNGYSSNGYRNSNNNGGFNKHFNSKRRDSIQSNGPRNPRMNSIPGGVNSMSRQASVGFPVRGPSNVGRPEQNRGRLGLMNCKNERGLPHEDLFTTQFVECSCSRCQESSRSVFVTMEVQDNKLDNDIQNALLKHLAQFNPVGAKVKHSAYRTNCLVEFHNDVDIARIIHWSHDPQNQALPGVLDRIHISYPLFSKYYIPRQRYGIQGRNQPHPLSDHNRRESNPYRNQQPVDTLGVNNDSHNCSGSLQHNFPNLPCNDPLSAPNFAPQNIMVYQQVQPYNQSRVLFNPNAPQRRDPKLQNPEAVALKTEQKLVTKTGYSQDVRKSRFVPEGSWRQSQAKSPSEEVITNETTAQDTSSAPSVNSVKASLSVEKNSMCDAAPLAPSGCDSPEVGEKVQDKVHTGKPQKERSQRDGPLKEQHRKDRSNKNKPQKDKPKKERTPAKNLKVTDETDEKSVASSGIVTPDNNNPSQEDNTLAYGPKNGEEGGVSSCFNTIETTKPVERTSLGEEKATVEDDQKSIASSRTMTPETTRPAENETMAHYKKKSLVKRNVIEVKNLWMSEPKKAVEKDDQTDFHEKQAGYMQTVASLATSTDTMEVNKANQGAATGGYSMTMNQLSSAVENVGYSTGTVIRRKTGRSALPMQWADAEGDAEYITKLSSPIENTQTGSTTLNRFNNVERQMRSQFSLPLTEFLEDLMSSGAGITVGKASVPNQASASNVALASNVVDTVNEGPATLDEDSAAETMQKPKPSWGQKTRNKKKKKAQDAGSQMTSRSNTPTGTRPRGPSPALDWPSSAAALANVSSSREASVVLQSNGEASSEGFTQSRKRNKKEAKNKRKRMLLAPETSNELAKSGSYQDDSNKHSAPPGPPSQKAEISEDSSAGKSAPKPAKTGEASRTQPTICPGNNSNVRSNSTVGSLRMPKNRSPKKDSQRNGSHSIMMNQAPTTSEAPSLSAVNETPMGEDIGAYAEASLFADQKFTIDQTKKTGPPKMSVQNPEPQPGTLKPTRKPDCRVALPKAALPLLQTAASANLSGDWASIAKRADSQALRTGTGKKVDRDPLVASDKDRRTLGDSIKSKHIKSPQKHQVKSEKDSVSSDKASSSHSPEKKCRRPNTTNKSQLNAAVESFNPSASCTSSPPSTKPRLNPNAATFSLASSPSQSVASPIAPGHGRMDINVVVVNTKENEKTVAAQRSVPAAARSLTNRGHAKKPSLPGHTRGTDKRFVTPAEQVLDANKVMQPPPPSKGARSTSNTRQTLADGSSAVPKKQTANVDTAKQLKDINTAPKTTTQATGDANTNAHSTSAKTPHETQSDSELTTLNIELFPTLDQAAAAGPTKKRRAASIVKVSLHATVTSSPVSGTVVGRDVNAASHTSASIRIQESTTKSKQTHEQRNSTVPRPAAAAAQQLKIEQQQTDTQGSGLKQQGDTDIWQTVAPKQKNGDGTHKGQGGRAGKHSSLRGGRGRRGGRGGRDGATEERKGG